MADGIYVALSGAIAQSTALESTASNLANASTDGYQRVRPVFREVLAQAKQRDGAIRYSTVASTALDSSEGTLRTTGNPLDVALPRGAYLAVSTATGERYTRAGALEVAPDGALRTRHGDPVMGANGKPIRLAPRDPVTMDDQGNIAQNGAAVAKLKIVNFAQAQSLVHEGATRLAATPAAGAVTPFKGQITVGAIEESNASVVGAMTDLTTASRTFEAFQRVMDAFNEADRKVVTTVPSAGT